MFLFGSENFKLKGCVISTRFFLGNRLGSPKMHCWWDRIYAPTYLSWSIPPHASQETPNEWNSFGRGMELQGYVGNFFFV